MTKKKKPSPLNKKSVSIKGATPREVYQEIPVIQLLSKIKNPKTRKEILKTAGPQLTRCIEAIAKNLLSGNIRGKGAEILVYKHRKCLEQLASKQHSSIRVLSSENNQNGGFLGALLGFLPTIASAVGSLFNRG